MSTPSPRQSPSTQAQVDESKMPQGKCRYILLLPEIKGERCACVNFTLNRAMPSATCDCGHLACFHLNEAERPQDQKELDELRQRMAALEEQLASGQRADESAVMVRRVSEVEERLDRSREEFGEQIKSAYRNITRSWNSIAELERQTSQADERLRQTETHMESVHAEMRRLGDRQLELADADISLEERLENLVDLVEDGGYQGSGSVRERQPRRRSTSDTNRPSILLGIGGVARSRVGSRSLAQRPRSLVETTASPVSDSNDAASAALPLPRASVTSAPLPETWTVHISLLPNASLPFPFERNTNAYQRCLSRGLHRTVAIAGTSSECFVAAVSKALDAVLKGRAWMPLQARLCDAQQLRGLPMLRPLHPALVDARRYDAAFLRNHCAVCDPGGNIDSLYIAMRAPEDSLSWHELRRAPVWMDGLEASWAHDPLLDGVDDVFADDDGTDDYGPPDAARPAAGDITVAALPSLKRAASEMSRSASFGAGTSVPVILDGGDGPLVKRSCPPQNAIVEVRRRRVETV